MLHKFKRIDVADFEMCDGIHRPSDEGEVNSIFLVLGRFLLLVPIHIFCYFFLVSADHICFLLHQPIFQRYPRPEKEYQSFSLIHSNEERSLDLVNATHTPTHLLLTAYL